MDIEEKSINSSTRQWISRNWCFWGRLKGSLLAEKDRCPGRRPATLSEWNNVLCRQRNLRRKVTLKKDVLGLMTAWIQGVKKRWEVDADGGFKRSSLGCWSVMSQASAEMGFTGPTLTASGSIKAFLYAFLRPCIIAEIYIERGHTARIRPFSPHTHKRGICGRKGRCCGRPRSHSAPSCLVSLCQQDVFAPPPPL